MPCGRAAAAQVSVAWLPHGDTIACNRPRVYAGNTVWSESVVVPSSTEFQLLVTAFPGFLVS